MAEAFVGRRPFRPSTGIYSAKARRLEIRPGSCSELPLTREPNDSQVSASGVWRWGFTEAFQN